MRLVDWGQQEAYQPLARGEAFPQYYENGDRYRWAHEGMWGYHFFLHGIWTHKIAHNTFDPVYLMGGEL
jgi:hypothetical protein